MAEPILTQVEEQEKWLADAMNVVKQQAFYMKRALDNNNMREALKFSAGMLSELRTSRLSPQKYYVLYIRVFDELQQLEACFREENRKGRSCADLYEIVQHAGNILPRLYLLCTVGSVYIKSKEAPAKDVLRDLVEMSRGVQHPVRGLFLRSYLSQISKDKLPDVGTEYEGEGGNIGDAVEFVLQNFTEMNKLWVRMQHQGPPKEKEKREKERSELRDLVGKNLHVLSQLDGVDLETYKTLVLPRILEQVVNCKDEIAQYYLMDCIIQVFPDEFHLQTLEVLLGACPQLQPGVDVKTVMSQLMDRLSTYAASSPEVLPEFLQVDAFNKLSSAVSKVVDAQPDMPLVGAVSLYVALLQFVLRVHSDRLDYVDNLLGACVRILDARSSARAKDGKLMKQLIAVLSAPLEKYNDVVTLLRLAHYPRVMDHLDYGNNKVMAVVIIQSVLKRHTLITDADKVEALLQLLKELIHDSDDAPPRDELDEDDFAEEQNLIARLVHVLANDDPDAMFKMLSTARKHFGQGGPSRLLFTLPPIVFSSLKLVRVLMQGEPSDEDEGQVTPQKIFQFLFKTVEVLVGVAPELAFRLYLQCAEAASECALEPLAYDFFTQAFILYEEEIADSKAQVTALQLIVGTLQRTSVFGADNRDTLTHKATGYSAKLLKKADQCRAVCACSHLFWPASSSSSSSSSSRAPAVDSSPSSSVPTSADADSDDSAAQGPPRDGERVVLCLKRALRIANAAQQMASASRGVAGSVALFVEILNKYLYYFDQDNPHVTDVVIQGLIELVNGEMQSESITCDPAVDAFYDNTLQHIKDQKLRAGAIADKYSSIQV